MRLALFQPDIPQNLGAARAANGACLAVRDRRYRALRLPVFRRFRAPYGHGLRRKGSDSASRELVGFSGRPRRTTARLLLFTTAGAQPFHSFAFRPDDILMMGRESAGAPLDVHQAADARIFIPLAPGARSLNIVTAAAIGLAEALRQTDGFHKAAP
jgi:tRNA (cytidine/uridine-2'-O-)-methyltransferase